MTLSSVLDFFGKTALSFSNHEISWGQLVFIPTMILVAWLVTRWVIALISSRLVAKKKDPNLIHLISRILYIIAIAVVIVTILDFISVPITAFAFLSGAVAIGFGFGAQNIINNFISGWILMWERPIRIGDFLEVGDAKGTVESINTRSTRFRRSDGVHMLIPNSTLLENTVVNWTLVDKLTRGTVRVGVAYGTPAKKVSELFLEAVSKQTEVISKPEPVVVFEDFGDSALIFDAYFWMNANVERELRLVCSEIRFRVDELFNENDIVISFPQRDVHLDGAVLIRKEA